MTSWWRSGRHTGQVTQDDGATTPPKYEVIADRLRQQIRSGEIPPGALLPSLRSLMKTQHASNKTVEQAVRLLVAESLVEAEPYRGYRVTGVDGGTLAARVARLEAGYAEIRDHLKLPPAD